MTFQELETQLLALPAIDKARVMHLLGQTLGTPWRGIEKNPGICGGQACIANTRISVWGLVDARRIGYSDIDLLTSYPSLTATDLVNAWIYAKAYPDEIEAAITENEAA